MTIIYGGVWASYVMEREVFTGARSSGENSWCVDFDVRSKLFELIVRCPCKRRIKYFASSIGTLDHGFP